MEHVNGFRVDSMNKCPLALAVIPPAWSGEGGDHVLGNSYRRDNVKESKTYLSAFCFGLFFSLSVKTLHLG